MDAQSIPVLIIAGISIYVGMFHLVVYTRRPQDRANLSFALTCFAICVYGVFCAGLYNAASPEAGVLWQRGQTITLLLASLAFIWFVSDYTKQASKKLVYGFSACLLVMALIAIIERSGLTWSSAPSVKKAQFFWGMEVTYYEMAPGPLTDISGLFGICVFAYAFWAGIRMYRSGERRRAQPLLIAILVFFIGVFNDLAVTSGLYQFVYMIEYSFLAMIMFMAYASMETQRINEEKFRLLAENVTDVIWTMDLNYKFTYVTPSITEQRGYSIEEIFRQPLETLVDPESLKQAKFMIRKQLELIWSGDDRGYKPVRFEADQYCKDGSTVVTENNASILKGPDGRPSLVVGVTRDITARKQAEDDKARLESQLRQAQKMEAIGTLAGGVAHDFNNILTAILGYGELAQFKAGAGKNNSTYLNQIVAAAERARDLVKQLLTFSRRSETELIPTDLNQLVVESVKMLEHAIPKMVKIEMKLAGNLDAVLADATQMEQVIMNLANNASDAMPEGGVLALETSSLQLDRNFSERHFELPPGRYIQLTVTDTGQGMDKLTLSHIFDPFFTTKEIGKGTGLGLATVYGIIKEHGGDISCYSEPSMGAAFRIYLPAHQAESNEAQTQPLAGPAVAGGAETILLVDDEPAICELAREILANAGYRILAADSGEKALEVYDQGRANIDLVIMDLGMPGMGGHKCLQELLELDPKQKVLIASGYSANGKVKDTLTQGAAGYIAKPFRQDDLLLKVRGLLDGPSPDIS